MTQAVGVGTKVVMQFAPFPW